MATRVRIYQDLIKNTRTSPRMREAAKKKKWSILLGDKVQVTAKKHSEYGKQGIVSSVLRKQDQLIVKGVNVGLKKLKGRPEEGIKARQIETENPINYSDVMLVDQVTGLPTRVGYQVLEDGTKVRVAKRSGAVLPKPPPPMKARSVNNIVTESDTLEEDAWEVTYVHPLAKRNGGVMPETS